MPHLKSRDHTSVNFVTHRFLQYGPLIGSFPVVDNIQACRQHVNDQGIDDELNSARQAIVSVHDARQADQAAKAIEGVNHELSTSGYQWVRVLRVPQASYKSSMQFFSFMGIWSVTNSICSQTVETKTNVAPDLSTWTEIDTEKTIDAHSTKNDALKNAIRSYVAGFSTLSSENRRHAVAIQACQALESCLLGDPPC